MVASTMSPLTMALLGGGMGGVNPYFLSNPSLMGANYNIGMGQRMMADSLNNTPAAPMQALGRLAQALAGITLQNRGMDSLNGMGFGGQSPDIGGFMKSLQAPEVPAPAPQASAAPAPTPAVSGGGQPVAAGGFQYAPLIAKAATANGVPNALLTGMLQQESQLGTKDPNIGQITFSTAQNPGYGMAPLSGADVTNPEKNINFAAEYLRRAGDAAGVKDWNDPKQWGMALRAYNGGGDPNYVQNVARWLPKGTDLGGPPAGTQYAQAGNVATDATPTLGPSGAAPAAGAPSGMPPIGMDNPHVKAIFQTQQNAYAQLAQHPFPYDPYHIAAQAVLDQTKTQLNMGAWETLPNGTRINTVTGETGNAATPLSHFVPTAEGYQDTTGQKPGTFRPAGRISFNPFTAEGYQSSPSGPISLGKPSLGDVASLKSAQAQGTKTGEIAAATPQQMYQLGREADTALGNIDYGLNQLHAAQQGGITAGLFAPWLATAAAGGKYLGVDLNKMGINPDAVSNIQSAQKTLAVVGGTILQNTIGKDSQITDAKIEHFIHTQPGIETDPNAIERIMNWARSQFVFNHNMSMDAMQHVDPNSGMLSPGWQYNYIARQKAFAPIYDPLSSEMKQPNGEAPPTEAPKPGEVAGQQQTQATTAAPQYNEGQTATGPGGKKLIFKGGQWQPM